MSDDQSTGCNNPPVDAAEPADHASSPARAPVHGVSRRKALWWVGVGALSAAVRDAARQAALRRTHRPPSDAASSGG